MYKATLPRAGSPEARAQGRDLPDPQAAGAVDPGT